MRAVRAPRKQRSPTAPVVTLFTREGTMPAQVIKWTAAVKTGTTVVAYRPRKDGAVLTTVGADVFAYPDEAATPGAVYDVIADFVDGSSVTSAAITYSPGGSSMPVGNLGSDPQSPNGWTQVFAEDFNTAVAETAFTDVTYDNNTSRFEQAYPNILTYPADWFNSVQTSQYASGKTCSVAAGSSVLKQRVHTDANGKHRTENLVPATVTSQLYGRYKIRWRIPAALPGYKVAWLLWPASEVWPRDGEIDFPEGSLTTGANIEAYMHRQDATVGSDQDYRDTGVDVIGTAWRETEIVWAPNYCAFFLDGVQVGGAITSRVPNTPMGWRIQTEGNLSGNASNTGISPATTGDVEIDWIVAYSRNA